LTLGCPKGALAIFPSLGSQLEQWSAEIADFRLQISDLRAEDLVAFDAFSLNLQSAI
jgi:hypothetical protein